MGGMRRTLPDHVVEDVLAAPDVRAHEVARARVLLESPTWCRAEEVAAELVDCYLGRRVP